MIAAMLEALRASYYVTITSVGPGWRLVISPRDGITGERAYQNESLVRVVRAAWAGEPRGAVT